MLFGDAKKVVDEILTAMRGSSNMHKGIKSKIGLVLASGYLAFLVLMTIIVFVGPSDGLAALIPLGLTMPWSFPLLGALPDKDVLGNIFGPLVLLVFAFSALLNAAILYAAGLLVTIIIRRVPKN